MGKTVKTSAYLYATQDHQIWEKLPCLVTSTKLRCVTRVLPATRHHAEDMRWIIEKEKSCWATFGHLNSKLLKRKNSFVKSKSRKTKRNANLRVENESMYTVLQSYHIRAPHHVPYEKFLYYRCLSPRLTAFSWATPALPCPVNTPRGRLVSVGGSDSRTGRWGLGAP